MAFYSKELEQLLASDKRKKHAVLITTNSDNLGKIRGKKLIEGTYAAFINYKELLSLKGDNSIIGVEMDGDVGILSIEV